MIKSVLITGGSGLVGSALTNALLQKGYQVSHLGRTPSMGKVKCFRWSIETQYLDPKALADVDAIVHLAGAGVAEKRWTSKRKKELLESRTNSTRLLYETLKSTPNQVKVVVSATAVGFYGLRLTDDWCDETQTSGGDFLSWICKAWEEEAQKIETLSKRLVRIRVGVVLSNKGGALRQMAQPVKWFAGAALASGNQWVSWIHIDDLCGIFIKAIENENMKGVYNGVAPNPVSNRELIKNIASVLHRPLWLPAVPEWALKIMLGEMSGMVVTGARVSCDKIKSTGFEFKFTQAQEAIRNLIGKK